MDIKINFPFNTKVFISGISILHTDEDYETGLNGTDGVALLINDEVWVAELDHNDGYRSYGSFTNYPNESKDTIKFFTFPPQAVVFTLEVEDSYDENMWPRVYWTVNAFDYESGEMILSVGTDLSDDYYPHGHCRWIPENLTVNKQVRIQES